jgi:hypothetical protein
VLHEETKQSLIHKLLKTMSHSDANGRQDVIGSLVGLGAQSIQYLVHLDPAGLLKLVFRGISGRDSGSDSISH